MSSPKLHQFRSTGGKPALPSWMSKGHQQVVPLFASGEPEDLPPEPEIFDEAFAPTTPPPEPVRPARPERADLKTDLRPGPPTPVAPVPAGPSREELQRMAEFSRAAIELAAARARAMSGVEDQLVDLAVAIASAIVEREIEKEPGIHAALARSALETLGNVTGARLSASRDAYAAITAVEKGTSITVDGVTVQVTLDPDLEGLGCVAETEHARVDARVEERLRAVRRALEDERARNEMEGAE